MVTSHGSMENVVCQVFYLSVPFECNSIFLNEGVREG